jgi:Ca2+/Na+ antiporter
MPFTSTLFLICILKAFSFVWENYYYSLGVLLILIIISVINCKYTYRNRTPKWRTLIALIAFVMSIFWIWFVAKILIEVLDLIGVLFDVPGFFLGMTLLSLGNSLPDLTLNSSLAKAGFGRMGLAGSIAGPLFNLLIGLGASLIKKTLATGSVKFELYKSSEIVNLFAIVILGLNLIRLLIQASCLRFSLGKSISIIGYLIYFLFFVGIVLLTFVYPNFFDF